MDDPKKMLEEFKDLLPIDEDKYNQLSGDGLNGYRVQSSMSGNVVLEKNGINILSLDGDNKSDLIQELNTYKRKINSTIPVISNRKKINRFASFGGNRKSKKSKKSKSKKSKSRKNRRKSNRRR